MGTFQFGERSKRELSTCKPALRKVMELAIKQSPVDFGISQGARSVEQQRQFYLKGVSQVNPDRYTLEELPLKGKHIVTDKFPLSRAADIFIYVPGKRELSYHPEHLALVAGVIYAAAAQLGIAIRWGGNWDGDGEILTDQKFDDSPHLELI